MCSPAAAGPSAGCLCSCSLPPQALERAPDAGDRGQLTSSHQETPAVQHQWAGTQQMQPCEGGSNEGEGQKDDYSSVFMQVYTILCSHCMQSCSIRPWGAATRSQGLAELILARAQSGPWQDGWRCVRIFICEVQSGKSKKLQKPVVIVVRECR